MLDDEIHYRILKAIEDKPSMSQRELAAHLGVSLGKANYCLKELIKKGLVKAGNFKTHPFADGCPNDNKGRGEEGERSALNNRKLVSDG